MTVYDRHYKPWSGRPTPRWSRFLVPCRYAIMDLIGSKLFLNLYAACFIPPLIFGAIIYFHHNLDVSTFFQIEAHKLMKINKSFYYIFTQWQSFGAYMLTLLVGPLLISTDYENNALPLYLVRPFSTEEYLLSKITVLVLIHSTVTWLPTLFLFGLQAYYEGWQWAQDNFFLIPATLKGSGILIMVLSLGAIGLGAAFKTRTGVGLALLATPIISAVFGGFLGRITGGNFGSIFEIMRQLRTIWRSAFDLPGAYSPARAWVGLIFICVIFIMLALRNIKAYEEVS